MAPAEDAPGARRRREVESKKKKKIERKRARKSIDSGGGFAMVLTATYATKDPATLLVAARIGPRGFRKRTI